MWPALPACDKPAVSSTAVPMIPANFRATMATDVTDDPRMLQPFDRIVIATGASYPLGTGPLVKGMLQAGAAKWPLLSQMMTKPKVRDWFYYRARNTTAERFRPFPYPGQTVTVIGDARKPGKSKEAIASAFDAALLGKWPALHRLSAGATLS